MNQNILPETSMCPESIGEKNVLKRDMQSLCDSGNCNQALGPHQFSHLGPGGGEARESGPTTHPKTVGTHFGLPGPQPNFGGLLGGQQSSRKQGKQLWQGGDNNNGEQVNWVWMAQTPDECIKAELDLESLSHPPVPQHGRASSSVDSGQCQARHR